MNDFANNGGILAELRTFSSLRFQKRLFAVEYKGSKKIKLKALNLLADK